LAPKAPGAGQFGTRLFQLIFSPDRAENPFPSVLQQLLGVVEKRVGKKGFGFALIGPE
jgi:hypothetical protein